MPEFCKYCESETTTPCRRESDARNCAFYDGAGSYGFMEDISESAIAHNPPTIITATFEGFEEPAKKIIDDFADDFGFTFEDEVPPLELEKLQVAVSDAEERMVKMYKMIDTFLGNLSANPEKPTIRWPNRAEAIDKFRKQLKTLMKG